jgi:hypothetical protein
VAREEGEPVSRHTSDALRAARSALGELGERGRTSRVPQGTRRAVRAYVEAARADGLAWWQIAETVGLSESALRRWREEDDGSDCVALLPVEVIAEEDTVAVAAPARGAGLVTLISPGGVPRRRARSR